MHIKVQIKILDHSFYSSPQCKFKDNKISMTASKGEELPAYSTIGSAGLDLKSTQYALIYPGQVETIHTGLAIWGGSSTQKLGKDHEFKIGSLIIPRSGLGTQGLVIANTIGVIDSDYQGELLIQALNRNTTNNKPIHIRPGQRIAQLVFIPVVNIMWEQVTEFTENTERETKGFGSSGE